MEIKDGKVAYFHYTLFNQGGEMLETSKGESPLGYIHGQRNIIPGLESALDGKSAGEAFTVTVPPKDAYGERDDQLVQTLPRSQFGEDDNLEPGMQLHARTSSGTRLMTISKVEGDEVTVDGNHPLAGETLRFEVEVTDVRDPTTEELEHGHVHGPGEHH